MIDRSHDLPVTKQAKALGISRGSVYSLPRPVSAADLAIMRRIDELHLNYPFAGSRMLRDLLALKGVKTGRLHVATLMKRMAIKAIYRKPNTSKPAPGHKIYPYLLRDLPVDEARSGGRLILVHSYGARLCLSRRGGRLVQPPGSRLASVDQHGGRFCVEALEEALAKHGKPEIFNTDQGSQFTSAEFTGVLLENGIAISMDGKGSWRDNVFLERLWRSVKYEEIYIRAYDTVSEARTCIGRYLEFYNSGRPHSSLDRRTPDQAYFDRLPHVAAA